MLTVHYYVIRSWINSCETYQQLDVMERYCTKLGVHGTMRDMLAQTLQLKRLDMQLYSQRELDILQEKYHY